jgi:chromosomal replication initiation ATPase DnaA
MTATLSCAPEAIERWCKDRVALGQADAFARVRAKERAAAKCLEKAAQAEPQVKIRQSVQITPRSVRQIVYAVADVFDVDPAEIIGDRRFRRFVRARFAAELLARDLRRLSMPAIGRAFHCDPTSIVNGVRKAEALAATDPEYAAKLAAIRERLDAKV